MSEFEPLPRCFRRGQRSAKVTVMRSAIPSVLCAVALASAVPATAATSIVEEVTFTSANAFPGFDMSASANGGAPSVFGDVFAAGATGEPEAALSFTDAGADVQSAAYRGMLNASILAVPEPSTWWAMIIGLGVIGYALRTRKRPLPQAV